MKMTNIYGMDETYIYGTYGNPEDPEATYGWYKSRNTSSVPGMLMVSLADAPLRNKPDDVRKFPLPCHMEKHLDSTVVSRHANQRKVFSWQSNHGAQIGHKKVKKVVEYV